MNDNREKCQKVLRWLATWGCQEVVVCAGARNAPLVVALSLVKDLKVWSFFEERSAAFFALGRMKTNLQPVAVVTTSGTAAAELLPATIEAHYTGLPLILITADRPPEYRGRGAPQSIEQVGLFSSYVEDSVDYADQMPEFKWSAQRPLHLNVCFSEPSALELRELINAPLTVSYHPFKANSLRKTSAVPPGEANRLCQNFSSQSQRPVVILGPLSQAQAKTVEPWLHRSGLPLYCEALSNLRSEITLKGQAVKGGEKTLIRALAEGWTDGVIRIGGIPTTRMWRDLEGIFKSVPVISFSDQPFSGLSRQVEEALPLAALSDWTPAKVEAKNSLWLTLQSQADLHLQHLLEQFPDSEPGLLAALAERIPEQAKVYLGNSLPVREWDMVKAGNKKWDLTGNRGANGIDGQLSTFFGFAEAQKSNWCILGDLTTLYDLSAPWILKQKPLPQMNLVIINNGGGKIFSRMYGQEALENHHQLQFSNWAKMWALDYQLVRHHSELTALEVISAKVIELVPDERQNTEFWSQWESFWKKN